MVQEHAEALQDLWDAAQEAMARMLNDSGMSRETLMTTLEQVQQLVDRLTPLEQVRLLEYLTPRIAQAVAGVQPDQSILKPAYTVAWQEFFQAGDALATSDRSNLETLTGAVIDMRR